MNNASGVFLNHTQLRALIADVTDVAISKMAIQLDLLKPSMSMHAAGKKYGKDVVERWLQEGVITKQRDAVGKMWRLDRNELETARVTENRHAHITYNNL